MLGGGLNQQCQRQARSLTYCTTMGTPATQFLCPGPCLVVRWEQNSGKKSGPIPLCLYYWSYISPNRKCFSFHHVVLIMKYLKKKKKISWPLSIWCAYHLAVTVLAHNMWNELQWNKKTVLRRQECPCTTRLRAKLGTTDCISSRVHDLVCNKTQFVANYRQIFQQPNFSIIIPSN